MGVDVATAYAAACDWCEEDLTMNTGALVGGSSLEELKKLLDDAEWFEMGGFPGECLLVCNDCRAMDQVCLSKTGHQIEEHGECLICHARRVEGKS